MLGENFDSIMYELTEGDLSKSTTIENAEFEMALSYLVIKRVKDLNDKKWKIEELRHMENLNHG